LHGAKSREASLLVGSSDKREAKRLVGTACQCHGVVAAMKVRRQTRMERGTAMFVLSNFLIAIAKILDIGLSLYLYIIIARAIISWVNPDPYNPIVRFLNAVTEPVLYRVRRRLPLFFGGIDFSPVIVILAIIFFQTFVVQSLVEMAAGLR